MAAPVIYLDNQATTPCDPRVVEAMLPWFTESFGNPHSAEHVMGRTAEAAVEAARAEIAALIGADAREIVLTSGATESNNLAIKGAARHARRMGDPRRRVVTVATEHACVLGAVADLAEDGFEPVVLPVGRNGRLDPATLAAALDGAPVLLVSVMTVNNETGVIQDVPEFAAQAHAAGALFHSDAAQAVGRIPVDAAAWRIDLLSLSGHKIYGPKGVGALFVRRRPRVRLAPLLSGGGQERGVRSGTVPVPLVVGLGAACRVAAEMMAAEADRLTALRARLIERLSARVLGLRVNAADADRVPGALSLTLPRASASDVIRDHPFLCLSSGSACTSAEIAPSHVLTAMGLSADEARRTLRIGLGRFTCAAQVDAAADAIAETDASVASAA